MAAEFPPAYVKPCLELVHGATTRLDELCNTVNNFLKHNCISGEEVQVSIADGQMRTGTVEKLAPNQMPHDADKQYLVDVDGEQVAVKLSEMARASSRLTKALTKAWLNSVARQQSLGVKGMTCVWLARSELLAEHGVPDALPEHINAQLAKTAKRREQRQRAKARAKAVADGGAEHAARQRASAPPGVAPHALRGQAEVAAASPAATASSPGLGPVPDAAGRQELLAKLAQAGATPHQLQEAAMRMQLQLMAQQQQRVGATQDASPREPADRATSGAAASSAGRPNGAASPPAPSEDKGLAPADRASTQSAMHLDPPTETIEESEAWLQEGSLKQAIFIVLKRAGPQGMSVADILEAVRQLGFDWGTNTRAGKSSIASTCSHDSIFLRLGPGRFTLRALPGALANVDATAVCSRQELEAVRLVNALEARQALAQARVASDGVDKLAFQKNTLKCGRCLRVYHPQRSPLVLCDFCPKAFHVDCLGCECSDLPEGEWACPKCNERHENNKQKLEEIQAKKKEALERVAAAEKERADKAARRVKEREAKDRKRALDWAAREVSRRKESGGKGRDEARRSARFGVDDLDLVEDEMLMLQNLERDARMRQNGSDPGRAVQEAILRRRRIVEGPPDPKWVVVGHQDTTLLIEALSVVEMTTVLQPVLQCTPPTLLQLQHAVRYPLDSDVLPELVVALLRYCFLDVMQLEAASKRSSAKRWARVLDACTWPDILRRYLLATRQNRPISDTDLASDDPFVYDPDHLAVKAALELGTKHWWLIPAPLLLRLLAVVCDDILVGAHMRTELTARFDSSVQLHTERYHAQAEERKREKESARARKEQLQSIRDLEARAEADNLPEDAKPSTQEVEDARASKQELMAVADQEMHELEERAREREELYDRLLDDKAVRVEALGYDRYHRRYWLFKASQGALWVDSPAGDRMGIIEGRAQVHELAGRLLDRGVRERPLFQALEANKKAISEALQAGEHPQARLGFALREIPRVIEPRTGPDDATAALPEGSELTRRAVAALVKAGVSYMTQLLASLVRCNVAGAAACQGALSDLDDVVTFEQLLGGLRSVEHIVAHVCEGVPKDADDGAMVAPVHEAELYQAEFVLPALAAADDAEEDADAGDVQRAAASGAGVPGMPQGDVAGGAGRAVAASQRVARGGQGGAAPVAPVRKVVAALEELDDSDAEPECKSGSTYDAAGNRYPNKPLRLWRSARDRATWLRDLRRAELSGSLSMALFCAAVLLDRSAPLTVRLENQKLMDEAKAADPEYDSDATQDDDEIVAPPSKKRELEGDTSSGAQPTKRNRPTESVGVAPAANLISAAVLFGSDLRATRADAAGSPAPSNGLRSNRSTRSGGAAASSGRA